MRLYGGLLGDSNAFALAVIGKEEYREKGEWGRREEAELTQTI